ncbi:serine carboxypeptidase S10 family member 1-like [Tubulanus polymorphus]|uniref:serine carboxypeptidase S10 family member 1-like n=1 Tax=Tubulanus polymorphus TaxID=672921 RepID=UPI003DA63B7B
MFYWFYESENTKPDTPLILFVPTKEAHLLYIDAPANSGFSYYKKGNYSTSNADDISQQIYEFFKSFLQKYPTYQDVPIHIYGHSFGGTVTPRLAKKIIEGSTNGHFPPIDLKGVVLSAPLVSAVEVIQTYPDYLFAMNMVTSKLFRKITDRAAVYVRATEATPRNNTEIVQSFYDMISLYSGNINANDLLDCGTYPGYSRVYSDIVRDNHLGNALSTNATSHGKYENY